MKVQNIIIALERLFFYALCCLGHPNISRRFLYPYSVCMALALLDIGPDSPLAMFLHATILPACVLGIAREEEEENSILESDRTTQELFYFMIWFCSALFSWFLHCTHLSLFQFVYSFICL